MLASVALMLAIGATGVPMYVPVPCIVALPVEKLLACSVVTAAVVTVALVNALI